MATGPTLPISGGTDMVAVTPGDQILPADFNNARTNINTILSAPTSKTDLHGLNQGGVSVGQAVTGTTIEALGSAGAFTELQNEIQAINTFYTATTNVHIQTDIVAGDIIEANEWNGIMYDTKARWDNPTKDEATSTKTYPVEDTWDVSVDGNWTGTLSSTVTFTWPTKEDLWTFFNAGGAVGMEGAIVGYSGTEPQTLAWETRLNNLGDVYIVKSDTVSGAGTNAGLGQVDLTTSYQVINTYAGSVTYTNDWANVEVQANDNTNPTSITVKMVFRDGDGQPTDEPVEGDTRMRGVLRTPNAAGSGFTFVSPSASQTAIVET